MITNLHELNIKEPKKGAKIRILPGAEYDGIPRSEIGKIRILKDFIYAEGTWTYYATDPIIENAYWYINVRNFELV